MMSDINFDTSSSVQEQYQIFIKRLYQTFQSRIKTFLLTIIDEITRATSLFFNFYASLIWYFNSKWTPFLSVCVWATCRDMSDVYLIKWADCHFHQQQWLFDSSRQEACAAPLTYLKRLTNVYTPQTSEQAKRALESGEAHAKRQISALYTQIYIQLIYYQRRLCF